MAWGKDISIGDWYTEYGYKILRGTYQDDYIRLSGNMGAEKGAVGHIALSDGDDQLVIEGRLQGSGTNIINGGIGSKNITIKGGLLAENGAVNQINFGGCAEDTRNLIFGAVKSNKGGSNAIVTGDGTDYLYFAGSLSANDNNSNNTIRLGNGEKHVMLGGAIGGYSLGGVNDISMGIGTHSIYTSGIDAYGNTNRISSMAGDTTITIKNAILGNSLTEITLGEGNHNITMGAISQVGEVNITTQGTTNFNVDRSVRTGQLGRLEINTGYGDDTINIKGEFKTEGRGNSSIITDDGDDKVIIGGKLFVAYEATSIIDTGDGNDLVEIHDGAHTWHSSRNVINTGEGDDTIHLWGSIGGSGVLEVNAGYGYDTLILSANDIGQFNSNFQDWLSNVNCDTGLSSTGVDLIQIDVDQGFRLSQISWLTNMLNQNNKDIDNNHIDMEINVDGFGEHIRLSSLFTTAKETSINGLDLSGDHANYLDIRSSLRSSGYDNKVLHVKGDDNDTVTFDHKWTDAGITTDQDTGIDYYMFHSVYGEDVMVQAGMNIMYV